MKKVMNKKLYERALKYHSEGKPGKIEVVPTKNAYTPEELSLAYTPGVAAPAIEIDKERWKAYRYTNKGNLVAVISNGSSVLGLGNIGALASKPIMEGKAMLFKRCADIDAFDIELNDEDPDRFIATVQSLSPTFGGINLEDIKAPECFYIEERLRSLLDIPVLHDDQHGTAVTIAAALINACKITAKRLKNINVVICGAGSAGIATARMLLTIGLSKEQIMMLDSRGVITTRRGDMNRYKQEFATEHEISTLDEAMKGADAFIGVSKGDILSDDNIRSMASRPIVFALANPTPEMPYKRVKEIRNDAIVATGRSDAPNQINNLLAFPYLFRGALDTLSTEINEQMKLAAAHAIADIAEDEVPQKIRRLYGKEFSFGSEYILPKPEDRRLITNVPVMVAKAAIESGVARHRIASYCEYVVSLVGRVENESYFAKESIRHKNRVRSYINNYFKEHEI